MAPVAMYTAPRPVASFNTSSFGPTPVQTLQDPLIAVVGCGYVGEELVARFSAGYNVLGYDISKKRVQHLEAEYAARGQTNVVFTTSPSDLQHANCFLISVPTLLLEEKSIDLSYLQNAIQTVSQYARRGSTVVIENSVTVGSTRKFLSQLATQKGYFVGMSPERVDPGRVEPAMETIPKVVSGLDDVAPGSLAAITRLYSRVFHHVVPVSQPEVAEMTKLYENCQRMMAIAYANEMADACIQHGIDPYEVSRAAATKPFGFMPFTPGVGIGGHCIPVNPYYLLSNSEFPLLKAATEKMWSRPAEIARRAVETLFGCNEKTRLQRRDSGMEINKRVLVVGIGFKAGQSVLSNSPDLEICNQLAKADQVEVEFADDLVTQAAVPHIQKFDNDSWTTRNLESFDMVIVTFKPTSLDLSVLDAAHGVHVEKWFNA